MSDDRYLILDQNPLHFVTFTVVDWVDVFIMLIYKQIITGSLTYFIDNRGLEVWAWCLMSNHLHAILHAKEGEELSVIIRDNKKFTSKKMVATIQEEPESRKVWRLYRFEYAGKSDKRITPVRTAAIQPGGKYKFWQESNYAVYLDIHRPDIKEQKINCIHENPVRAEIVDNAADYLYSLARDYCGRKGLVKMTL